MELRPTFQLNLASGETRNLLRPFRAISELAGTNPNLLHFGKRQSIAFVSTQPVQPSRNFCLGHVLLCESQQPLHRGPLPSQLSRMFEFGHSHEITCARAVAGDSPLSRRLQ